MGTWKPTKVLEDQTLGTKVLTWQLTTATGREVSMGRGCLLLSLCGGGTLPSYLSLFPAQTKAHFIFWPMYTDLCALGCHWGAGGEEPWSSRGQGCQACQARILHTSSPRFLPAPQGLAFGAAAPQLDVSSEESSPKAVGRWATGRPGSTFPHNTPVRGDCSFSLPNTPCPFHSWHLLTLFSRVPFTHFYLINTIHSSRPSPNSFSSRKPAQKSSLWLYTLRCSLYYNLESEVSPQHWINVMWIKDCACESRRLKFDFWISHLLVL